VHHGVCVVKQKVHGFAFDNTSRKGNSTSVGDALLERKAAKEQSLRCVAV